MNYLGAQDYQIYTNQGDIPKGNLANHNKSDIAGFRVKHNTSPDFPSSWKESWLHDLQDIYSKHSDINIFLSGGADSSTVTLGFLECGYDVNHTIILFKDHDYICNAREVKEAFKLAGKYRIKYDVLEINVLDFLDAWKTEKKYSKYSGLVMDTLLQLYSLTRVDPSMYTIISDQAPSWYLDKNNVWQWSFSLDQLLAPEFFNEFGINGHCRIFQTSPKTTSAWLCGEENYNLIDRNALNFKYNYGKTSKAEWKYSVYKIYGFDVEQYFVPKTSVQMFDKHKFLKQWHTLMDENKIATSKTNLQMAVPLNNYRQLILDGIADTQWMDYKDFKIETINGPWYGS